MIESSTQRDFDPSRADSPAQENARLIAELRSELVERRQAEAKLRASNEELTRFNRAMIGRELRIVELKKEVDDLCALAGLPPRYVLDFVDTAD